MKSAEMRSSETASVITLPKRETAARRQDTAFLPAALEIIETPPSPVGRAVVMTIIAFMTGVLGWSIFGQVDIVATAQGRVIPTGKSKVIQPFETGVVREIMVADGQMVEAGDVLVELDPTTDMSDEKRLQFAYMQDRLDMLRLRALLAGKTVFDVPNDVEPSMASVAERQMEAQIAENRAKLEGVERQSAQKRAEGREIKAAIEKIEASLPLISEQRDIRSALLANQYGSRLSYLQVQQQVVESQHELDAQKQRREENVEALAALDRQHEQIAAEYRKNLLADLAKAQVLGSEHSAETAKAAMRRKLRTLRAPVGGSVQQLAVNTLGGVVTPAQPLMVIVPQGAGLEIEATLANKDIGFVHKGQPVEIKIETFDFTRYGLLHGVVESVSQDAVMPQDGQDGHTSRRSGSQERDSKEQPAEPSYVAHVSLAGATIRTEHGLAHLEPGMAITAEIKTGKRTIIDFLLSPLRKLSNESLTER